MYKDKTRFFISISNRIILINWRGVSKRIQVPSKGPPFNSRNEPHPSWSVRYHLQSFSLAINDCNVHYLLHFQISISNRNSLARSSYDTNVHLGVPTSAIVCMKTVKMNTNNQIDMIVYFDVIIPYIIFCWYLLLNFIPRKSLNLK